MVDSVRTRRAFSALSSSRNRGRSGPVWVVRADAPEVEAATASPARPQVAYALGRRLGNAVMRNRLRRQLRALLDDLERDGALPPGLYLVGATAAAPGTPFAELGRHLGRAVSQVRGSVDVTAGAR